MADATEPTEPAAPAEDAPAAPADTPAETTPEQPAAPQDKDKDKDKPPPPKEPKEPKEPGPCVSPTPSGEELPPDESNKIIALTLEILQLCQKKVDDQKIGSHSLSFMLLRVKESLDAYFHDYIPMLNTYLVNAEQLTADYYANICCTLPEYGDFVKSIEHEEGDKLEVGFPAEVPKSEVVNLVKGVTDNYHAQAMFLKASRANFRDVSSTMPERKDMVVQVTRNIPDWLKLQDNVTKGLEDIREQAFKMSAYVDFLKQGESKVSPTLDLSKLGRGDDSKD